MSETVKGSDIRLTMDGVEVGKVQSLEVNTAPKELILPKVLYHATHNEAAAKIMNEGLKPLSFGDVTYLAEKQFDALKFGWFHHGSKPKNLWEKMPDPRLPFEESIAEHRRLAELPDEWYKSIVVFGINTAMLPKSRFELSDDHNANYFAMQGEAYVYTRKIPRTALMVVQEVPLNKGELML